MLILDCGQMFVDTNYPGVDAVLPDFSYILENADKVVGCVATHAHEDHIGGLPYLMRDISLPIYGSAFTLGMIRHKLNERDLLGKADLHVVKDGDVVDIGIFNCEFIPVTHSTPSGLITAIKTPQGTVLHSSDFKLDLTPVDGRRTGLSRIGALADEGIRLLLCDSTNADSVGQSTSESTIGPIMKDLFVANEGRRMIVAAFSSHIHRLQQIIDAALATGRTIATLGLSMGRNVQLAREMGLLIVPDSRIVDIADAEDIDPAKICILCTGSQGETRAALTLMATGDSKWTTITDQDTVVFSSHPIPGNEGSIGRMQNDLARSGARIVHTGHLGVHTTGHGKQHELKTLHSVASPEWFVPVHGEYTHLVAHRDLAYEMMDANRVVFAEDGDQLTVDDEGVRVSGEVSGQYIYVDGIVGALDERVLDDRVVLGGDGFLAIQAHVDFDSREISSGPVIVSRGWLSSDALFKLESKLTDVAVDALNQVLRDGSEDTAACERVVRRAVGRLVSAETSRRPMLVPMITGEGGAGSN
jgi:ribonuclease J